MIDSKLRRKQIITFIVFSILLFAACTWSIASGEYKIPVPNFFKTLIGQGDYCLLYTSPSPRDRTRSRMPSSA